MKPKNIKIRFGNHTVTLKDETDRKHMPEGIEIYLQKRQSDWRPWADVPDAMLEKYKHCQPVVISAEWDEE